MKDDQRPIKLLHALTWGTFDHASYAPQVRACNYYLHVYVHACVCACVCVCAYVCNLCIVYVGSCLAIKFIIIMPISVYRRGVGDHRVG